MTKKHRSSEQGVALIIVLSLVAVMAMLAMVFFSSTAAESQTSQSQSAAQSAQQLASSAAQIVMAQIQLAGNQTAPGNSAAVAWTSQPGLLRTFTVATPSSSASTVYKLYSATNMVATNYTENEDAPPSTWKSSPAIYCDLNAPVARGGNTTSLAYPIADPSVAGVVPGFTLGTAPGYSGSNPSPTNNPLPMPVRWLYVLKNGQLNTPSSVDAGGNVTFTSSDPQPSAANPVVGRIAFWADDETCKVNINTAGYAKNDVSYWTYWDTPYIPTRDEAFKLGLAQPWNNEFLRYPGHPATTGLNVVFEGMSLTANQTASLTPRYNDGGTLGGNNTTYSANATSLALKTTRIFPTVDEMFFKPANPAPSERATIADNNDTPISQTALEARRFFLTATSRAPETTLFDTPRVTTWPVWQTVSSRTPLENLIAFCSTIGSQPFYFMRNSSASTSELSLTSNDALFSYLQTITGRNLPGIGGNFRTKYDNQRANDIINGIGANTSSRDQILTSFFDAIRLANLYDQTATTKYTAANPGWVNSTDGNGTFTLGRNPTLDEVNLVFTRGQTSADPASMQPNVLAFMYYQLNIPTVGSIPPALNCRMEVSGLSSFTANGTQIFPTDTWSNNITQTTVVDAQNQKLGGRTGKITTQGKAGGMPLTSVPLTAISTNSSNTFAFTGGNLTIKLFSPPALSNTNAYQTFTVRFPDAAAVPVPVPVTTTPSGYLWSNASGIGRFNSTGTYEGRPICNGNDSVLSVATKDGDIRSRALKKTFTVNDFAPHADYGVNRAATTTIETSLRLGSLIASPPTYPADSLAYIPKGVVVESNFSGSPYFGGDWDSGMGYLRDGSYAPKADEGQSTENKGSYEINYFYHGAVNTVAGFFTPNRQIPSPGIFGNIPTGTWRTLLFRPARSFHMGGATHFGATSPHDMYLLDFFHMPVVEPYAISEPFSTAGKINMNAKVIPFSGYLTRETALRAVLASTRLTAISPTVAAIGQTGTFSWTANNTSQTRYPLNIDETLLGFRDRYASATNPRVFLSEAEICNIDLIPDVVSNRANLSTFWTTNRVTGDNARERPYAMLLPRLTTRSNSYTVHVTAQALAPGPGVVGWQEGRGKVLSEWRGAYTIERYVDPNDARFTASGAPNFLSGTQPVGPYYRFRVLGTRRFNP
jgi:hypothetical protein